jgi:hypothetical protein
VQKDQARAKNERSRRALGFTEKNMIFDRAERSLGTTPKILPSNQATNSAENLESRKNQPSYGFSEQRKN